MKISIRTILSLFNNIHCLVCLTLVVLLFLIGVNAQAEQATGVIYTLLRVNSPACTMLTNTAVLALPAATSPSQTLANYFSVNGFTLAGQRNANWVTSSALNQTAVITCAKQSTPIQSLVVQPASGAITNQLTSEAYMVDSGTTPQKAAAGNLIINFEQVSVNGIAAPLSYDLGGLGSPYNAVFYTSAVPGGAATVIWRPGFWVGGNTSRALGIPQGGSYSSPGQVVVNY